MDQPVLTAVLPLLGVLIGGVLQYYIGKTLEGRKQLALQKSEAYADLISAAASIAQDKRSTERLGQLADAKVRICLYGSSLVIHHLSLFEESGANINSDAGSKAFLALLAAMSADTRVDRARIEQNDLRNIVLGPSFKAPNRQ